jgi:Tol biopolymer transport system component
LWRIKETGSAPPERLAFPAGNADEPSISRQGDLAYSQKSIDINVWRAELSEPGAAATRTARLISSTQVDGAPQFSPDGKRIVFTSGRGGTREIWMCDADGSNTIQLSSLGAPLSGTPRWSPDGSRIAFDSNLHGQWDVYLIDTSGGTARRLTDNSADDSYPLWSHDGSWIYFMSSRSGRREIWRMPDGGGEAVQLTMDGGVVPFGSPDGEFLYYSEKAGQGEQNGMGGLRRLRLAGGAPEQVLPSVTFANVAIVRDGIYYIPRADQQRRYFVHFFSFRTGETSTVVQLSGRISEGLTVSPDGRTLLYTQIDEEKSDLMFVRKFH